jgi:phytoene/squalene synthetase
VLLVRGTLLDRQSPDLGRLRAIDDPDRFAWAILPHVARSFAASVVLLPAQQAAAARVGYLYARMLDTYEDMVPDTDERITGLRWFATRFATGKMSEPAPPVRMVPANTREEVHKLLVDRCDLVDRLYAQLPDRDRTRVATMVGAMSSSMERWGETFARQGGVLESVEQLDQYCDDVIGEPARFAVTLLVQRPLTDSQRSQVSSVSELVQLANVTRDIERDLEHGVAYHPSLRPHLGAPPAGPEAIEAVRSVREELLVRALRRVPAYTGLLEDLQLPAVSRARGSAVLMLLFTDRYYRECARRAGHQPWKGANSTVRILASSALAALSRRAARRVGARVKQRFLVAADAIEDPS